MDVVAENARGGDCSGGDCGSCVIVLRGAAFRRSELKLKVYFSPKLNYRGLTTNYLGIPQINLIVITDTLEGG